MSNDNEWKLVWWFPLMRRRTGMFYANPFLSKYGTAYRWIWE